MALTHQLDRRDGPIRKFFESRFPAQTFKPLSKTWYETVRAAAIVCQPPQGVNAGTIGTAFDYRARLCWAPVDWAATVAAGGALYVAGLGRTDLAELAIGLRDELSATAPSKCALVLSDSVEDRVCRCCYALALYEQFFR